MDTDWTLEFNNIPGRPRGKKRKSAAKRKEWDSKYGFFGASVKAYSTMFDSNLVSTNSMSAPNSIISYLDF